MIILGVNHFENVRIKLSFTTCILLSALLTFELVDTAKVKKHIGHKVTEILDFEQIACSAYTFHRHCVKSSLFPIVKTF